MMDLRDLGDFQTPPALVAAVLDALGPIGARWPRVLEPTCGRGGFLAGLIGQADPPREIRGFEIQPAHCLDSREVARASHSVHVEVRQANLFDLDLRRDLCWKGGGPLLVVGNPPWITNTALGVLGSTNLPIKSNFKRLRGIDAKTGASNFDIAEAVWLKLIRELADEQPTIALLCKTSAARAVLKFAAIEKLPVVEASIHKVDARIWFHAVVDACLCRVTLGPGARFDRIRVFRDLLATEPEVEIGHPRGRPVANLNAYDPLSFADGVCPMTWRQGLKHDAAAVMELEPGSVCEPMRNRLGESVAIEPEFLYPLLKCTDLFHHREANPRRSVIVTQRRLGEDTRRLEHEAPRLWGYLRGHATRFERRKSSIYRGKPPFALFGVGPYAFAPYKVAVSGLHKTPRFRAIGPVAGRPVMLDDTCYFLPCSSPDQAALVTALWNDPTTLALIRALTFLDSKRPITKALLRRIDLGAILMRVDRASLRERADEEWAHLVGPEMSGRIHWPRDLERFFGEPTPDDESSPLKESSAHEHPAHRGGSIEE